MNRKHQQNQSPPEAFKAHLGQWPGKTRLLRLGAIALWGLATGASNVPAVFAETAKSSQPQHRLHKGDFSPPDGRGGGQPIGRRDAGSQFQFTPPDGSGGDQPTGRRDTGSRRACKGTNLAEKEFLTALIPEQESHALTVDAQATLFFYIPYANIRNAKLVLENAENEEIETIALEPDEALPGAIAVRPTTQLEVETSYNWVFSVECQGENEGEPTKFFVEGTVTRVSPSDVLVKALASATTDRERAALYAQNGIWFDALALLAQLRREGSENEEAWAVFLSSVGLNDLASKPVIDCCRPLEP